LSRCARVVAMNDCTNVLRIYADLRRLLRAELNAVKNAPSRGKPSMEREFLPLATRSGADVCRNSHTFIHRHIRKWFAEDAVVDRPRSQADAVRSFG